MVKNRKDNKGITLIALIITIIVLLILSALTIGIVLKGDLFGKAQKTISKANERQVKAEGQEESIKLDWNNLPGESIKSATTGETTIQIEVYVSDIKSKSFVINAKVIYPEDDNLIFSLNIDGEGNIGEKIGNEVYWTVTGLTPDTEYTFKVIAKDTGTETSVSGKVRTLELTETNEAPVIVTNELDTKTTTELYFAVKATDADGDSLIYELYTSTSETGVYTKNENSVLVAENTQTTLSATGLENYKTYWWYITVSDGEETVTSEKQSVKTYCPGGTVSNCGTCNGTGEISYTCSDGYSTTCSTCNGSKKIKCPGSPEKVSETVSECPSCGNNTYYVRSYKCSTCGTTGTGTGCERSACNYNYSKTDNHSSATITCTSCSGTGKIYHYCDHSKAYSHTAYKTCTTCKGNKTVTATCSHGYTKQHD